MNFCSVIMIKTLIAGGSSPILMQSSLIGKISLQPCRTVISCSVASAAVGLWRFQRNFWRFSFII